MGQRHSGARKSNPNANKSSPVEGGLQVHHDGLLSQSTLDSSNNQSSGLEQSDVSTALSSGAVEMKAGCSTNSERSGGGRDANVHNSTRHPEIEKGPDLTFPSNSLPATNGVVSTNNVQNFRTANTQTEPKYDAFVLWNAADNEFVSERFLPKVEQQANLKLCLANRDLPPGDLVYDQQMNYMFERSRKLVVILSDEFFTSGEYAWHTNLAILRDPAARQRKIIPVKYKKVETENILDCLVCCDFTKTMIESWAWKRIINGIQA